MSAPDPEGEGAEHAMRTALEDAAISADEIAYLNLHGTGTSLNDAMECAAIARVFRSPPACSSTKPLVGHTLGAAGAMEAGFCWLMLAHAETDLDVMPHVYDGQPDPALPPVPLAGQGLRVPVGPVMTNSFGFGGNNCTLVLERVTA
jgi:3-oxoacyl-[acyl-carrier-protein] synthase-1